jgi:hypothetical protein
MENRMSAPPTKSIIRLLTPDRHESPMHSHVTLFNQHIRLDRTPKLLSLTFNTHITYTRNTSKILCLWGLDHPHHH